MYLTDSLSQRWGQSADSSTKKWIASSFLAKKYSRFQVTARRNKTHHFSKVLLLPSLRDPLLAILSCFCCSATAIHKFISSANCLSELFLFRLGSGNKAASKRPGKLLIPFQRQDQNLIFKESLSLPHFERLQLHLLLVNLPFTFYLHFLMLSEAANQSNTVNQK